MNTDSPIFELVGVGESAGILTDKSIVGHRDHLIKELVALKPDSRDFLAVGSSVVRDAKQLLKKVEVARETVKGPVLELSRKIDAIAKEFRTELAAEVDTVERQIGEIVRKEREARIAEEARIKAEQEKILAEELARKAELQAKIDKTKSAAKKEDLAMQMEQVDADTVADLQKLAPALAESRTPILSGGSQVRARWTATVTDWKQAFEHCPQVFDVTFSASKFQMWAKLNDVGGELPLIPGITTSMELKASIR